MEIYKESCKNCLLSKDSIVSPKSRKDLLQKCARDQSHFICHKASMEGKDICCHTFFTTLGYKSQLIRIMGRLNALKMVEMPAHEKLPTYSEMNKKRA